MKGGKKHLVIMVILAVVMGAIMLLTKNRVVRADGPIYVDRDAPGPTHDGLSWATAYTTVQEGLDAATPGDEIWVAEGVYTPTNTIGRWATFQLMSGVALYGGFLGYGTGETLRSQRDWETHVTVLSGDLDGNDVTDPSGVVTDTDNITGTNAYHVVTGSGVTETAVLDGFTITGGDPGGGMYNFGGSPTLTNVTFSGNYANYDGGGMYNGWYSNPTLTDVTFSGNGADDEGGGMYNDDSNPTLTNVTFSDNYALIGGGMYNDDSNPTLIDVTFSGNGALAGGGMDNDNSSPTLINVTFSGNNGGLLGGGMINYGSDPTLTNVTFSGNTAYRGSGMHNDDSSPTLINVTFSGNTALLHGGGMDNDNSDPTLTNVTFSSNTAGLHGGGMDNDNSNPTLSNCILWGNTASDGRQIHNEDSSPTISYSLVGGGYGGTGNLDADPLFVDFDGTDNITGTLDDNLRLLPTSPAIDAGDNTTVPTDTLDLDGDGDVVEPLPFDLDGNPRFADVGSRQDTGNGTPPIVDMGAYEATVLGLAIAKSVDTGGLVEVPLGGVVTYSLVIRNSGDDVVSGVVVTDPMPVGLTFGEWVDRGSAQLPPPVTWGPWDVGAGTAYTLSFTAHVTENISFVGQIIANTAHFTAANQAPGTSNPATFTIEGQVFNNPPVADAGVDQTVLVSTTVMLDGSGSTDPDGHTPLAYGWAQTSSTSTVLLSSSTISRPTFTAPGAPTVLTFSLTVTDALGLISMPDIVAITVTEYTIYLPLVMRSFP
jgi:uncharacterized repeat protein (TIGR01451 family)